MFRGEMDSMKSKLESNFSSQKKVLINEFNERLKTEKQELKMEHEKQLAAKDDQLKKEIESLRIEFESKKRELEADLRAQFSRDISNLREELERAREISKEVVTEHKVHHNDLTNSKPRAKSKPKSKGPSVLKEIEGLESDIEKLRSQVQKGSRIIESDDSTEEEFVPAFESRVQRVHHMPIPHYDSSQPNGTCTHCFFKNCLLLKTRLTPRFARLLPPGAIKYC